MLNSLAIIPDGTRRYAQKVGISIAEAYELSCQKAEEVFDWCLGAKIKNATIYALSSENLNRGKDQLKILFGLYKKHLAELIDSERIHKNEVRVRIVGSLDKIKGGLKSAIDRLHAATADYTKYTLNIALAYGGRAEMVAAAQAAAAAGKITEENFSKYLYVKEEPDLLIRTSGMQRLSNFLPWQTAYTELYFCESLWPEFSHADFDGALNFYYQAKRNFGR